jgi:hypothetical protein
VTGTISRRSERFPKDVQQRASHARLAKDISSDPAPPARSSRGRLGAIIVPASRPASFLQSIIELSAFMGVVLVVLCSKQTRVEHVATRVSKTPGARSLVVRIPEAWGHQGIPTRTSKSEFKVANANRESDLSAKRNIGLLLARLHGWSKIAFVDDDIKHLEHRNLARLAAALDGHHVAGMVVRQYPDNSVVCHARRFARLWQDVFVTGAVLGVRCDGMPPSFFPDVYNEDWFFFAEMAAARELPHVGEAMQEAYDPFLTPERATWEEFGDLLAEGIYALMEGADPTVPFDKQLQAATTAYWSRFIEVRHEVLNRTLSVLCSFRDKALDNGQVSSALASLTAAKNQLCTITPSLCGDFLNAWREDLHDWQRFSSGLTDVGSTREAMDVLQLKNWTVAEFGAVAVDSETEVPEHEPAATARDVGDATASALDWADGVDKAAAAWINSEEAPDELRSPVTV